MKTKATIKDFLAQKTLALAGISRGGKKFSNKVYSELKSKGYRIFPVNPHTGSIEGERCYPDLTSLPEQPGSLLVMVPPAECEKVVKDAVDAGIRRIWLQQGTESDEAVQFCEEHNVSLIHGECILMFAEPVGVAHRIHRWIWKLLGKLPKE